MNIVVLLKQVPDTAALIQIGGDDAGIRTEDVKWVINPYDELAVEEAILIKERLGTGNVTILTIGPESAVASIRTALAMGADEGILVCDPALEKADAQQTARVIAAALKNISFDLVIAGPRAVDDDGYYVPPAVAEYLGIPLLSAVIREEVSGGNIRCDLSVEDGVIVAEAALPALMTTQRGLNDPRYPSLSNIMRARKKEVKIKTLADIGLSPGEFGPQQLKTRILSLEYPPGRNAGKTVVEGETAEEKAARLVALLKEKAGVL